MLATTFGTVMSSFWPHMLFAFTTVVSAIAVVHAAMTKRDVRAAIAWVGVILFSPLFGAVIYFVVGINRIRKQKVLAQLDNMLRFEEIRDRLLVTAVAPFSAPQFAAQKKLGDTVNRFQLLGYNQISMILSGDEAYSRMISVIEGAQRSIAVQSYIFDHDKVGIRIAQALIDAKGRGVEVRVLIDSVGSKYSRPTITKMLEQGGVKVALFMTTFFGLRLAYANLRCHRKLMIIDGVHALTGGMNIRQEFSATVMGVEAMQDTHFDVRGPVVHQLMLSFAQDWSFTTGESLTGEPWFFSNEALIPDQGVPVRCVPSAPDDMSLSSNHSILLGALSAARHHVRIQSPYFLPDTQMLAALSTAARRGVVVDIVVPGANNLKMVGAAMMAQLDQVLEPGCRVWRASGTFDHSKLCAIDSAWSYIGSSNIDPRSLRLNFELDLEIFDQGLAKKIEERIDSVIASAEPITLELIEGQAFLTRLRNKIAWLFSPYL
ncbi:cardiolipin synthase [Jezberella montanilacus]|uniref:Cardiolipin synthase n=2 Tax=Jezberella montanilacus TaxID=323426 RepID=A0A2T0XKS8_9BURK|nr:cardiolipin synthase [Jezberella montanilacus]